MKKLELINTIAKDTGIAKVKTAEAIGVLIKSISKALKRGESVTIIGFGTFKITKTKARKGINPQTGKVIQIKAGKRVRFVAGKALKTSVK